MNRIRQVRQSKGLTQQEVADALALNVAQVSRMERGQSAISLDRLDQLAAILEVTPAELMRAPAAGEEEVASEPAATPNAVPVRMDGAAAGKMQENLPIFGTALGAPRLVDGEAIEQTDLNTGEIVQYVRRPPILENRQDAYGLYVQGHSMEPVHLAGDLVLSESKRPAKIGDDVIVYLRPLGEDDDGSRARAVLIKRLVKRTASFVELEQYNPPRTFRLPFDAVLRIDRVMRLSDLIG